MRVPNLLSYLCCFIAHIISTAALPAVNNNYSAGVCQAVTSPFSAPNMKKRSLFTPLIPSDNSSQILSLQAEEQPSDSEVISTRQSEHIIRVLIPAGRCCYWHQQHEKACWNNAYEDEQLTWRQKPVRRRWKLSTGQKLHTHLIVPAAGVWYR